MGTFCSMGPKSTRSLKLNYLCLPCLLEVNPSNDTLFYSLQVCITRIIKTSGKQTNKQKDQTNKQHPPPKKPKPNKTEQTNNQTKNKTSPKTTKPTKNLLKQKSLNGWVKLEMLVNKSIPVHCSWTKVTFLLALLFSVIIFTLTGWRDGLTGASWSLTKGKCKALHLGRNKPISNKCWGIPRWRTAW